MYVLYHTFYVGYTLENREYSVLLCQTVFFSYSTTLNCKMAGAFDGKTVHCTMQLKLLPMACRYVNAAPTRWNKLIIEFISLLCYQIMLFRHLCLHSTTVHAPCTVPSMVQKTQSQSVNQKRPELPCLEILPARELSTSWHPAATKCYA